MIISSNISGVAAYAAAQGGSSISQSTAATAPTSFDGALESAMKNLTQLGQDADAKSVQAMSGGGNLTDVVMAVSKAEMALQASVAVRDKIISAYQDVMRMAV